MTLTLGDRVGPYQVVSLLGTGGMGEVYRARDAALGRDVALKVLPDAVASDPERLARFEREARTLASINHPHIAQVYGLEQSGGTRAIVMELVEGDDLSQRISRGPLPIEEVLPLARHVADALDAAHAIGIVHRDLKPANIKVRGDGTAKVLDFGLARAYESDASGAQTSSPTITSPAMTMRGAILGTAAYMAPEQAKGKPVDKRADIWAFGCVLYEMLTGARAFHGDDVTETLAAVVRAEPDWSRLPADTPVALRRLLARCLQKDRSLRLADIADARLEITEAAAGSDRDEASHRLPQASRWRSAALLVTGAAVSAVATISVLQPWRADPPSAPLRLSVNIGVDAALAARNAGMTAVLSRDGTQLAFVAQKPGSPTLQLYLRRLDQLQADALEGTEDAQSPFFSPDGEWVAYFAGGKLRKVSTRGGAPITLADAPIPRGGTWDDAGTIVFAPDRVGVLKRVSSSGGAAEEVTRLVGDEQTHRWPQVLPDGAILYTAHHNPGGGFGSATIAVQPSGGGSPKVVQTSASYGRFVTSGHLVYVSDGILFAVRFDPSRLELSGSAIPVVEGVASNNASGGAQFALSATGSLVYLPGVGGRVQRSIDWIDGDGKRTPLRGELSPWTTVALAPDGRRLALQIVQPESNIWIFDVSRGDLSRLTFNAGTGRVVWSPDGRDVLFTATPSPTDAGSLFVQRSDGSAPMRRLTNTRVGAPTSWHPGGTFVALQESDRLGQVDIWILPLTKDSDGVWQAGEPTAFLRTPFEESQAAFSPDGRWVAYDSNETGRSEVYVRAFPSAGAKVKVSTDGGIQPVWSPRRSSLFYRNDRGIMAVPFTVAGGEFRPDKPRLWAEVAWEQRGGRPREYDLHPDGERFAVPGLAQVGSERQDHAVLVFNFVDELRRLAPPPR